MTDNDVLKIFRETNGLLAGHFLLRSGLHSAQYFQCALVLQYPRHAEKRPRRRFCLFLAFKVLAGSRSSDTTFARRFHRVRPKMT